MKSKFIFLLTLPLLFACGSTSSLQISSNTNSISSSDEMSFDKAIDVLNNIDLDRISHFNLLERCYGFDYYYDYKYIVTGDASKAVVNYQANYDVNLY